MAKFLQIIFLIILTASFTFGEIAQAEEIDFDFSVEAIEPSNTPFVVGNSLGFVAKVVKSHNRIISDPFGIAWHLNGEMVSRQVYFELGRYTELTPLFEWPATLGTHTIKFIIDDTDNIEEAKENNNEISYTFTVKKPDPLPDLWLKDIKYLEDGFYVTYCNQGVELSASSTVTLRLTVNNISRLLNNISVPKEELCEDVTPGTLTDFSLPSVGNADFAADIDYDNSLAEEDETNNGLTKSVFWQAQSDDEVQQEPPAEVPAPQATVDVVENEKKLVTVIDQDQTEMLKGRILLQVEQNGEAWYVHTDGLKYYLRDGGTAFTALRNFGLGITNADLKQIPIGLKSEFNLSDSDNDGLDDKLEEAIGTDSALVDSDNDGLTDRDEIAVFETDPLNHDSDNDGYTDGTEVRNGYSPLSGVEKNNSNLGEKLKGRILLQVQNRGEAWYVNPVDGKRYYLANGETAYQIMRHLSLGITNLNLRKIAVGQL